MGRNIYPLNLLLNLSLRNNHGGNSVVIRNSQLGFNAVCPNEEDVCCEKPLEVNTNVTENCADDLDYYCVGIQVGDIYYFVNSKIISFGLILI